MVLAFFRQYNLIKVHKEHHVRDVYSNTKHSNPVWTINQTTSPILLNTLFSAPRLMFPSLIISVHIPFISSTTATYDRLIPLVIICILCLVYYLYRYEVYNDCFFNRFPVFRILQLDIPDFLITIILKIAACWYFIWSAFTIIGKKSNSKASISLPLIQICAFNNFYDVKTFHKISSISRSLLFLPN